MKKPLGLNSISFLLIVYLVSAQTVFCTPPSFDIITKVENPEHYENLAFNHEVFKEQFPGCEITSLTTPLKQKEIVSFYVNIVLPRYIVPNGIRYEFGVWTKFIKDSLTNYDEIKNCRQELEEVIKQIENRKFVRLFRKNVEVESEYLYWNGKYIHAIRSLNADTLVTFYSWPPASDFGQVWWFSFYSKKLLDILEIYMGPKAFNEISVFAKKVGLGHVRQGRQHLFVSSGRECSDSNSCFTESGGAISSYKLTMQHDWPNFPFFSEARASLQYYVMTETKTNCLSADTSDKLFAILCPPDNNRPRRVYIPLDCDNTPLRIISFQVGLNEKIYNEPIVHDLSIIDSLYETFGGTD
jgi:hypothetical protein